LDPWFNLPDVSRLLRRKMMIMMRMMVELVVFWPSAVVEKVMRDLLEMVGSLGLQMTVFVMPIWLI
jgi:hypothetical protein